jgi:hypothetical protein
VTLRVVSDDGETVRLAGSSHLGRIYGDIYLSCDRDGDQLSLAL